MYSLIVIGCFISPVWLNKSALKKTPGWDLMKHFHMKLVGTGLSVGMQNHVSSRLPILTRAYMYVKNCSGQTLTASIKAWALSPLKACPGLRWLHKSLLSPRRHKNKKEINPCRPLRRKRLHVSFHTYVSCGVRLLSSAGGGFQNRILKIRQWSLMMNWWLTKTQKSVCLKWFKLFHYI